MEMSLAMGQWERMSGGRDAMLYRGECQSLDRRDLLIAAARHDLTCPPADRVMDYLLQSHRPPTVDIPNGAGES
jgi:hypothetical protein